MIRVFTKMGESVTIVDNKFYHYYIGKDEVDAGIINNDIDKIVCKLKSRGFEEL